MKKIWIIVIVIILIIFVVLGYFYFTNQNKSNVGSNTIEEIEKSPEVAAKAKLIIGNPNAPVTIIEYGDFKCPLCNTFFQTTEKQIQKEFIETGQVKLEYRTLPIIAADSKKAAEAAYCSNDQSKFAQYHDALFNSIWNAGYKNSNYSLEDKDYFNNALLTNLAQSVGMDSLTFQACLTSAKYSGTVAEDTSLAKKAGASSTPTFFIDSEKVSGPQPFSIFAPVIKAKLQ